ncbi:hypothetical protein DPMN_049657 [Dreissena polymorpha]|uniref:C1q domain-containing protein n=1 Tax=Dreissena polymorpha TaxID=45954 RepID=A0A9D4CG34_DREPO|nr:hypothetical protein DPMN_049657 [Dreissena polymorpha]
MLIVDNANEVDIVSDPNPIRQEFETMSSNTVLLRLKEGQSVWMEHYQNGDGSIISGNNWRYTTFSGVSLYSC